MLKLLLLTFFFVSSIYTVQYTTIDGANETFNSYQGKKILIVNIATGSENTDQIGELQQLYQIYHDSLEIVAFPSNSFGHEARTNAEIKQFCQNNYGVTYQLGAKGDVNGASSLPIYNWLCNQGQNGTVNATMVADFEKFLVDKNGQIIGIFGPDISPIDSITINAITEN
jgi:glutathione peroxidase